MLFCTLLLLSRLALADIYLHSPRGSNNKLSETSNGATNQRRLFDSQNNNNGGYQVPDNCGRACDVDPDSTNNNNYGAAVTANVPGLMQGLMHYYHESEVYVEWTQQHGCGSDMEGERQGNLVCTSNSK